MIAPHQNREVQLVLSGVKPLATIERSKDLTNYAIAISLINSGMLRGKVRPTDDDESGEVVFTQPSRSHLILVYEELLYDGVLKYGIKSYHRRMGKLFGYADEDIEEFIETNVSCECSKCGGSDVR